MFKTQKILITVFLFFLVSASAVLSQEIIVGNGSWDQIRIRDNITYSESAQGMSNIQLKNNEYQVSDDTDMLLHFNGNIADRSGNYTLVRNQGILTTSKEKKLGEQAGAFPGDNAFVELSPGRAALLAAGNGKINDFSIEFWLYPIRLSEGEKIFQWSGAIKSGDMTLQQTILCVISGRRLNWVFENFFLPADFSETMIELTSTGVMIPGIWHHHLIRYDSETGLIEYLIDGIPEVNTYANSTGRETGEMFAAVIGNQKPANIILGKSYSGYMDELRLTRAFSEPDISIFGTAGGSASTSVFDLQNSGCRLLKISTVERKPGKTDIFYYYRISEDYFNPLSSKPAWVQFKPDQLLPPSVRGRFVQIKANLYPDGTGKNSPVLSEIRLQYERNLPPLPPEQITAESRDGSVRLSWNRVNDSDISGYKVYYGEKPGYYFSSVSVQGPSPVDTGDRTEITLTGLKNGQIYYFAVTSYDSSEKPQESRFSKEISARPSALLRTNQ